MPSVVYIHSAKVDKGPGPGLDEVKSDRGTI